MLFDAINQLSHDGPLTLEVTGDCMSDIISLGSRVQIGRRRFFWPGDIVVYGRGDDQLVSHRFLGYAPGRRGWCGITQADSTRQADAPVVVSRIIGKVLLVDRAPVEISFGRRLRSVVHYLVALTRLFYRKIARVFGSQSNRV